jgi:hypothetical protein
MSFYLTGEELPRYSLDLPAAKTIFIAPLAAGIIYHSISVEETDAACIVLLVRTPGTFEKSIIVDSGPIELNGNELYTSVFNISDKRLRIAKGQVISRLISVEKG